VDLGGPPTAVELRGDGTGLASLPQEPLDGALGDLELFGQFSLGAFAVVVGLHDS
jgi:hypothetical protein